ncbi:TrkH family potassium uptake protein [Helicovermis profundi]|uniref:TrkH family potassium uptake protein n=1 Tax=Helicovermis profundi TaxID=3065157 RepID=A0AAU9EU67_9FIRM|nr:TrkH family potassium uptake protein [Clostridia bacterium S502]
MIKTKKIRNRNLNPAQVLVLGFLSVILIGTFLLNLPIASNSGRSIGFVNALFTSTSAVCVTGLVVVDTGTFWTTFGKVVILLLIQIGGLGFMTMATSIALIVGKRISLKSRMIMQEALNQFTISGVVRLTKYIIYATFLIEGVGAFFLSLKFIPIYGLKKGLFFSVFHAISAFCNAGFDIIGNGKSLTPFVGDGIINITIMTLIIVGGLGFTVVIDMIKTRNFKRLSLHSKFVIFLTLILLSTGFILVFILEFNNPLTLGNLPLKDKILAALFHSVTPRTAGFNTLDMGSLKVPTQFLTIVFMFIGGSPSSTAGGIKTTTFGLVILHVISVIMGKDDTEIFKRRISREAINRALAILSIGISVIILITMILTITETSLSFLDLFFETVSALGTVGLTLGITAKLSIFGKLAIAATMFFGRLGPLTIVIALARRKQNGKKGLIRYPEGKIIVG